MSYFSESVELRPALAMKAVRWRWSLISLAALATGVASFVAPRDRETIQLDRPQTVPAPALQAPVAAPRLPARESIGRARADPFTQRSWAPAAPLPPEAEAPPAPGAPSNPYRFAGTAHYRGSLKAIFVLDNRVYAAPAGEVLDGGYRVQSVSPHAATLVYLPLGIAQHFAHTPPAVPEVRVPDPQHARQTASRGPSPFPPGSPLGPR